MPIKIQKDLPAFDILKQKNVFVMDIDRAEQQDIRPLKIGILNLMPEKESTETQIFRMLGNSPLQVEPILIKTSSYNPKHVTQSHLEKFYVEFSEVQKTGLDGLIITGAPVEQLAFEEVAYWNELQEIMNWAEQHVTSVLFLCWGAQAGLYHFYNIQKQALTDKVFGVYRHTHRDNCEFLLRGLDDVFFVPHSYHTFIRKEDVLKNSELEILAESEEDRLHIVANKARSLVFVFGHPEYDRERLAYEYFRDKKKGLKIQLPQNYFPNDDDQQNPQLSWRANAETFYRNWINLVYQTTNYDPTKYRMDLLTN